MPSTNQTPHYNLPEFVPTDKPAWLVDWNGAMGDIDTAIYTAESKADAAAAAASSATADISNIQSSLTSIQSQVTTLTNGVIHAEGDINTINSLIGSGEPTTQEKTIIGAINELAAEIPSGGDVAAEDVTYDNTSSGLVAVNVQSAIDEIQTEVNNLIPAPTNRRVIFVADSYGTVNSHDLPSKLETLLSLGSGNFYDFSYNSMGFSQTGGGGGDPEYTALQYMQSRESDVASPSTITDIIVTIGLNDIRSNYTAVEEANVLTFINYCKSTYPNAKIHYGFIGNENGATTITDPMTDLYYDMLGIITKTFRDEGCTIIEGIEYVMHDALNFGSDWIHPNSDGAEELAKFINEHLSGLKPKYQKIYTFTNSDLQQAYIAIDGAVTSILPFSFREAQMSLTGSGFIDVMDFSGSSIRGMHQSGRRFYFPLLATVSGNTTPLMACFTDSKLQVYSNSSITITAIAAVQTTINTLMI